MESPIQPHEAKTIYIQFSDTGRHIRKWSLKPFEGAIKYEAQPVVSNVMAGVTAPPKSAA